MIVVGGLCFPAARVLAATTSFKQQILPLHCIFQTVDDGTGTLYYVTPKACGVVETPPNISNGSNQSAVAVLKRITAPGHSGLHIAVQPSLIQVDLGDVPYLSTTSDNQVVETFRAIIGQEYTFTITITQSNDTQTTAINEQHTLVIDAIDTSDASHPRVTISLHSTPLTVSIGQGETKVEALGGKDDPKIVITVTSITASGVDLTIWQLPPEQTSGNVKLPASSGTATTRLMPLCQNVAIGLGIVVVSISVVYVDKFSRKHKSSR